MKSVITAAFSLLVFVSPANAQLLKKLKDKVGNAAEKKATPAAAETTAATAPEEKKTAGDWCSSVASDGTFQKIYSGAAAGSMNILYDESCLGLGNDGKGYTMVITERRSGKTEYVIISNGTETGRYSQMKDEYLPCRKNSGGRSSAVYLVADSTKVITAPTKSTSVTAKAVDQQKVQQGVELAKQTDEYKKMSAEEKKQFDEMMKSMPQAVDDYNKDMAGKTFNTPGSPGYSGSYVSGYRIVVNKKEYGKFALVRKLIVSPDEKNVYAIAADQAGLVFVANDKKINLVQKGFNGGGQLLVNASGHSAMYIEMLERTAVQMEQDSKDFDKAVYTYRVLRPDGKISNINVTGNFGTVAFKIAGNGTLITVNPRSGEITAEGKPAGKFNIAGESMEAITAQTILIGESAEHICYYGDDGSLNFPDGTKQKLGIFYPSVAIEDGRSMISWFRQCGKEIYTGTMKL